ncbi:MAG: protein PhnA [Kiritimatiellia bacterium]|jgi:protein PhnA
MARGKNQHDERKRAVAALGKNLSRRARSRCELCGERHPLTVIEVDPVDEDPHEDAAMLACETCREALSAKRLDPSSLRFLETAVWEDPMPTKIAAITLLRRLQDDDIQWAREVLDGLWLDEAVEQRLERLQ